MDSRRPDSWFSHYEWKIAQATKDLPADMPLAERVKVVAATSPGPRPSWLYKMWLAARREYLGRFGYKPKPAPLFDTLPMLSPLDRERRKYDAGMKP